MEKLNSPEQQDTEAEHSLSHLHKEVVATEHTKQTAHHAFEMAQQNEILPTPEVTKLIDKVLAKCLDNHRGLQKPLLGKQLEQWQSEIFQKHPELWSFITLELKINNFSCDGYDHATPTEKIKLLALHGAMHDLLPLAPGLKTKSWAFDVAKLRRRYMQKLEEITVDVSSTFQFDQRANAGQTLKTLQEVYGMTTKEATMFKQYLEKVTKEHKLSQPDQGSIYGYLFAFIAGVAVTLCGVMVYDRITNPKGMAENNMWEINLGDPSLLAKLVTAEQPFTVNGTRTESLYDTTNETGLARIAQDIINSAQSRTVTMSLDGKVVVEYDIDTKNGAVFMYDPKTKFINVQLPHPTFKIRDQKATILARNSELIEIAKFNNTEQNLLDELNEKALQEIGTQQALIYMSMKKASEVIYTMYGPILHHFKQDVIGIQVTVTGQAPQKFLP